MESLNKIDGLSDVANNVINRISSAVSWLFTRETPKRISINNYIADIKASNLNPIEKAVLINRAAKDLKEYSNQYQITEKALSHLKQDVNPSLVSEDWLLSFFDKARLVSDDDFQEIWAKILAGEFEKPGSYSLRTLEHLKGLNKREAETFASISKFVIRKGDTFFIPSNDVISKECYSFSDILMMDECGLISSLNVSYSVDFSNQVTNSFLFNSNMIVLFEKKMNSQKTVKINIPCYSFTKAGIELVKAINVRDSNKVFILLIQDLINKYKNEITITAHDITKIDYNGLISYKLESNPL